MRGLIFVPAEPLVRSGHIPRQLQSKFPEVRHESPFLPEVGKDPSSRLQGGPPPWQGLRDLQVEPAFQSAPALKPKELPKARQR
jgi:hypothetical protein